MEPGFRYNRAPIVEAQLAIGVDGLGTADVERFGEVGSRIDGYPRREVHLALQGQVRSESGSVFTETRQQHTGYRYLSEDGRQMFLAQTDGFTFGRLAPYDTWTVFVADAMAAWDAYRAAAEPALVTRTALRYINQIPLATGQVNLDELLRTYPEISDAMPSVTSGFFLHMTIPLPEFEAELNLIETIAEAEDGTRGLVLDIEVQREINLPINTAEFADQLRVGLASLREAKNTIFEACITDNARRLFD